MKEIRLQRLSVEISPNDMGINAGTHRGSCSHRWHSATLVVARAGVL
jgi:hypothetical protein